MTRKIINYNIGNRNLKFSLKSLNLEFEKKIEKRKEKEKAAWAETHMRPNNSSTAHLILSWCLWHVGPICQNLLPQEFVWIDATTAANRPAVVWMLLAEFVCPQPI
jgi:hypothetical protein